MVTGPVIYSTALTPRGHIAAVGDTGQAVVWCAPPLVAQRLKAFGESLHCLQISTVPKGTDTFKTAARPNAARPNAAGASGVLLSVPGDPHGSTANESAPTVAVPDDETQSPEPGKTPASVGETPAPVGVELVSTTSHPLNGDDPVSSNLAEMKVAASKRSVVEALDVKALARTVAGVMVAFENVQRGLLCELAVCLSEVFIKLNVDSEMLVEYPDAAVLLEMILKGLKENAFYSTRTKAQS